MCDRCTIDTIELLDRNQRLEHENTRLRGAVQRAICGQPLDATKTCQLPRHHEGQHAWSSSDGEAVVQWA